VLDRLQTESAAALKAPAAARTLKDAGFIVVGSSRDELKQLLDSEAKRWTEVVKATGFKAN
jgi:tripartite-type tricarboxylate transporter receptor subunit TctC